VAVPTEDVPVPFRVTLPGGWDFKLSKGILVNDKWSPKGPEWLEGTELCRWVALPWSLQLEAVVRTLALDDPIILTMSNADEFEFKVKSIQNIPIDDINTLDSRSACLFLILVNPDSDTRWVVTAKP
jgi:3-methyladenine DNA glycosylase AlkC